METHLPTGGKTKPITVIGTQAIRETFDQTCLQQAINSRLAPGVTDLVLNPDGHLGYGAPVGCVMASPTHVYPGPVGVDIKCSMSLLQLDLPADQIEERPVRRALIDAVCERLPLLKFADQFEQQIVFDIRALVVKWGSRSLLIGFCAQKLPNLRAHGLNVHTDVGKHVRRNSLPLADESE